jgi:hypothetical protein
VTPAPDTWLPRVDAFLATLPPGAAPTAEDVLGALSEAPTRAATTRAGQVLRSLGYAPVQRREQGQRVRRYQRSGEVVTGITPEVVTPAPSPELPSVSEVVTPPIAQVSEVVTASRAEVVTPPSSAQNRNRPALGVTRPDGVFEPDWPAGWTLDDEHAWSSVVYGLRPRRAAFGPFVARVAVS